MHGNRHLLARHGTPYTRQYGHRARTSHIHSTGGNYQISAMRHQPKEILVPGIVDRSVPSVFPGSRDANYEDRVDRAQRAGSISLHLAMLLGKFGSPRIRQIRGWQRLARIRSDAQHMPHYCVQFLQGYFNFPLVAALRYAIFIRHFINHPRQ